MRILFLSSMYPNPDVPTCGTFNAALCRSLSQDHDVHVIAPRHFTERYSRKASSNDSGAQNSILVEHPTYWYTPKCLTTKYGSMMWWSARLTVNRVLRQFQPDVVLSYWAHPDGEVGLRVAKQIGVPAAVIVGGTDVLILPQEPRRGLRIRNVLTESDAVITVSDGLNQAVQQLGVNPDNVHTIYQGVFDDVFHSRISREESRRRLGLESDRAHLLWVGRMVPIKGLDVLLRSMALLRETSEAFVLHLLGDGPLRPELEALARTLGLQDCVRFEGSVDHQRLGDWYRAAGLTVLSSHSEGLPNVLRESLACGTPFTATNVGSIREIAVPEASRLVTPNDPAAFMRGIQEMLTPEAREAARLVRVRTWNDTARETAALLESLRDPTSAEDRSLRASERIPFHSPA